MDSNQDSGDHNDGGQGQVPADKFPSVDFLRDESRFPTHPRQLTDDQEAVELQAAIARIENNDYTDDERREMAEQEAETNRILREAGREDRRQRALSKVRRG